MAQRVHRRDVRRFFVGIVALVVVVLISAVGVRTQMGEGLPAMRYTYLTAEFRDVGWLSTRADVVQNGVRIGQVDAINHRDGRLAVVRMRLEGDKPVYRNASATISNASALGKRRIVLDPGSPEAGLLGDRPIPVAGTEDSRSFDDIYSGLDPQTRKGLASSLRELGGGLAGHGDDLRSFLRTSEGTLKSLRAVSSSLASPDADLEALLTSAKRLVGRFATRQGELTALLKHTDETFRAVNVDGAKPLDETLKALPASLRQARRGLDSLNSPLSDLRKAMSTLEPGGRALGEASNDLRGVLREAVDPLGKVPGVSRRARPAIQDLTRTFAELRPLVPRLARTLNAASVLLHDLAPYAPDIGRWASEHDVLSGRVRPGQHYLSLTPIIPGSHALNLPDPTVDRDPYPEPGGGAWHDNGGGR